MQDGNRFVQKAGGKSPIPISRLVDFYPKGKTQPSMHLFELRVYDESYADITSKVFATERSLDRTEILTVLLKAKVDFPVSL